MRKFLALFLVAGAMPALGQFIGFTSPQTVQKQLGPTQTTCATVPQDYPVQNLGQTEHYLTVSGDGLSAQFSVNIIGIDVLGRQVAISDELDMAGGTTGSLFASGYYPKVIVEVTCQPNTATYTLTYSGTWGTPPGEKGNFLQTQIGKQIFHGISGDGGLAYFFIPPFGSSAGELFFQFTSGQVAGSTISVLCQAAAAGAQRVFVLNQASLASDVTQQNFTVPNFPCPIVEVLYASGGNGSLLSIGYVFGTPGMSNWTLAVPTRWPANVEPLRAKSTWGRH